MRKNKIWVVLTLALSVFAPFASAQYDKGSIVGTVHDSTGSVVSGATVTATNVATSIAVTAKKRA
jgi:hypothetical protein